MTTYILHMTCGLGGDETMSIEADSASQAEKMAKKLIKEWVRDGDWGAGGAIVDVSWKLIEEISEGSLEVEIEPDHGTLIKRACGRIEHCCGLDPDDHQWTSEGEGGCDENPGVWSTGGTGIATAAHCRVCGLRQEWYYPGSQRNPGEHDTVEYEMPESWCAECQSEECECPNREKKNP